MADEVALLINGKAYRGWTQVAVTRALDAISGAFAISLTERWAGSGRISQQVEPWPILNGDRCQIKIGDDTVIDGYVDQFRPAFGPNDHTIEIQGRDKTADLVDCSAFHQPDQWKNLDLLQIAKILCAPFGVSVRADVDVGDKFPSIKLQQGETVFAALDRLARFRKVILSPDLGGGVLITRAGRTRSETSLQQGVNIKSASGVLDDSQRFSLYVVKGQNVSASTDDAALEGLAEGRATDSQVTRYRPLLVMAETGANNASAKERAIWEANVRLGRGAQAQVSVRGWRQTPGGRLWTPNIVVPIRASFLRMDGDMLVRQVTYRRTEQDGTVCDLDLVSPQAFSPEPPDRKADKAATGKAKNIWKEALGDDE